MQSLKSNRGGGQASLGIIALICIIVAGYFIIKQSKTKEGTPYDRAFYYCTSCKKEFTANASEVPPTKCPTCKQITGVLLRKYKCNKCKTVFPGYMQKYKPDTKRAIERRRQGEKVPDSEIGNLEISEPETEDWMDSSKQEAFDFLANIRCPKCEASGADIEAIFPKQQESK
ncbi:MAG: hypothetical protein Q8Q12_16895 [bacterium]|nr:hypothetical protein [bacterium]